MISVNVESAKRVFKSDMSNSRIIKGSEFPKVDIVKITISDEDTGQTVAGLELDLIESDYVSSAEEFSFGVFSDETVIAFNELAASDVCLAQGEYKGKRPQVDAYIREIWLDRDYDCKTLEFMIYDELADILRFALNINLRFAVKMLPPAEDEPEEAELLRSFLTKYYPLGGIEIGDYFARRYTT